MTPLKRVSLLISRDRNVTINGWNFWGVSLFKIDRTFLRIIWNKLERNNEPRTEPLMVFSQEAEWQQVAVKLDLKCSKPCIEKEFFGWLVLRKWLDVLGGHQKMGKVVWSCPYTTWETRVNAPTTGASLPWASSEKCMLCALKKDDVKWFNRSRMMPVRFSSWRYHYAPDFHSPSSFLRNLECMPKTFTHVLSTSRKYTTAFLVKSFGECCGRTVLTVACYW